MICKHPVEKIEAIIKSEYVRDEYDCLSQNHTYFLKCKKCKKLFQTSLHDLYSAKSYEEFTGREVGLAELKNMFKKNNEFFHEMRGKEIDVLKEAVMQDPVMEKKLERKRKAIIKQQIEFFHLLKKYRGGTLDEDSHVKLQQIDGTFDEILSIFNS